MRFLCVLRLALTISSLIIALNALKAQGAASPDPTLIDSGGAPSPTSLDVITISEPSPTFQPIIDGGVPSPGPSSTPYETLYYLFPVPTEGVTSPPVPPPAPSLIAVPPVVAPSLSPTNDQGPTSGPSAVDVTPGGAPSPSLASDPTLNPLPTPTPAGDPIPTFPIPVLVRSPPAVFKTATPVATGDAPVFTFTPVIEGPQPSELPPTITQGPGPSEVSPTTPLPTGSSSSDFPTPTTDVIPTPKSDLSTPTLTLAPEPTTDVTPTPIPIESPTDTPIPTDTPAETPILSETPTPAETPTNTPTPTDSPTDTPTPTETPTPTSTPTDTPTPSPTRSPQCAVFASGGDLQAGNPVSRGTCGDTTPSNSGFGTYATVFTFSAYSAGFYNFLTNSPGTVLGVFNSSWCSEDTKLFAGFGTSVLASVYVDQGQTVYAVIYGEQCSESLVISVTDVNSVLDLGVYVGQLVPDQPLTFDLCSGVTANWIPGQFTILVPFLVPASASYSFTVTGASVDIEVITNDRMTLITGDTDQTFSLDINTNVILVVHSYDCGSGSLVTLTYEDQPIAPCLHLPVGPQLMFGFLTALNISDYTVPVQSPLSAYSYGASLRFIAPESALYTFQLTDLRGDLLSTNLALISSSCEIFMTYTAGADYDALVTVYLRPQQLVFVAVYSNSYAPLSLSITSNNAACRRYGAGPVLPTDGTTLTVNECTYPAIGGYRGYAVAFPMSAPEDGIYTISWTGQYSSMATVYAQDCTTILGESAYTQGNRVSVYLDSGNIGLPIISLNTTERCVDNEITVSATVMPVGCTRLPYVGELNISTPITINMCDYTAPSVSNYTYYAIEFTVTIPTAGLYAISSFESANSFLFDHYTEVFAKNCGTPVIPVVTDGRIFYGYFENNTDLVVIVYGPSSILCGPVDLLVEPSIGTPTPTPSPTASSTPTASASPSPTSTPSDTPSPSPSPTPFGCAIFAFGGELKPGIEVAHDNTFDAAPNNAGFGSIATAFTFVPVTTGLYNLRIDGIWSVRDVYDDLDCLVTSRLYNEYTTSTFVSLKVTRSQKHYVIVYGIQAGLINITLTEVTGLCARGYFGPSLSLDTAAPYNLCRVPPTAPSWGKGEYTVLFNFTAPTRGLYTFTANATSTIPLPELGLLSDGCSQLIPFTDGVITVQLVTDESAYILAHGPSCSTFTIDVSSQVSGCGAIPLDGRLALGVSKDYDTTDNFLGSESPFYPEFSYGNTFDFIIPVEGLYTFYAIDAGYSLFSSQLSVLNMSCLPIGSYNDAQSWDAFVTLNLPRIRVQAAIYGSQPSIGSITVSYNRAVCNRWALAGVITNATDQEVNLCSYPAIGGTRTYSAAFPFRAIKTGLWIFSWAAASGGPQEMNIIDADCSAVIGTTTPTTGGRLVVRMLAGESNFAVISATWSYGGCFDFNIIMNEVKYLPSGCANVAQGNNTLSTGSATEYLCDKFAPSTSIYGDYAAQFDFQTVELSGSFTFSVGFAAGTPSFNTSIQILGTDCRTQLGVSESSETPQITVALPAGVKVYVVVFSSVGYGCGGSFVVTATFNGGPTIAPNNNVLNGNGGNADSITSRTESESSSISAATIGMILAGSVLIGAVVVFGTYKAIKQYRKRNSRISPVATIPGRPSP